MHTNNNGIKKLHNKKRVETTYIHKYKHKKCILDIEALRYKGPSP